MNKTFQNSEQVELIIKRSRFIAIGCLLTSADAADQELSRLYQPAANHHCWAWRVGQSYRFNDDGEPSGTAGKPILAAMDRLPMDHALIVVIRYFGGIKLGTGGLMRAYGGAATTLLDQCALVDQVPTIRLGCRIDFAQADLTLRILQDASTTSIETEYCADGIHLNCDIDSRTIDSVKATLSDALRGQIVWDTEPDTIGVQD